VKELPLALQIQQRNNLLHLCEKSLKELKKKRRNPTRDPGQNHPSRG